MTSFKEFGLPIGLVQSLERAHITTPTPIQAQSIPVAMEGHDLLASAQTGTGKTIAYLLPLVKNLIDSAHGTALILAPTRELADQIRVSLQMLLGRSAQSDIALLIGGAPIFRQFTALKKRPRFIIGTPGRINDHLLRGTLVLRETRFLVLDETDRMLDMGFSEDLDKIVKHLPKERQTLMFSATMPPNIIKLSQKYLNNPKHIAIGETTQPAAKIQQKMLQTSSGDKYTNLLRELDEREGSVIIFVKTKISAAHLADKLKRQNHSADAIHGDLKQRRRDEVIRAFRNNKNRIMVATDIAARGLDIPHIKHVINYDLPQCAEDYIHRIGRTGRAGMEGFAISFVSPGENRKWQAIYQMVTYGKTSHEGGPRRRRSSSSAGKPSSGKPARSRFRSDRDKKHPGAPSAGKSGKPFHQRHPRDAKPARANKPVE